MPIPQLDEYDRKILAALQEDGRLSNAELAERIHLSPSPTLRRVKALEQAGYITGYRAQLDRQKAGLGTTVLVGIKVDSQPDADAAGFQALLKKMPEVIACHIVSGGFDFLLECVLPDMTWYESFLFEKLFKLPMVKDVHSIFIIRTVKRDAPLPLGHLVG